MSNYRLAFRATTAETRQWGDSAQKNLVSFESYASPDFRVTQVNWSDAEQVLRLSLGTGLSEAQLQEATDKQLTVTVDGVAYSLGHYAARPAYHEPHYQGSEAQKLAELLKQTGKEHRFYCHWHD